MKLKKALIFGITGQDGIYLSKFLSKKKHYKIFGVTRNLNQISNLKKNILRDNNVTLIEINLNHHNISSLINKILPHEIYNLAGVSSVGYSFRYPKKTFNSIVDLNIILLEILRKNKKIKLFIASSCDCFGDTKNSIATENTQFKPLSPYGIAKTTAYNLSNFYRKNHGVFVCSGILSNHESKLRTDIFVTKKIISSVINISKGNKEKLKLGDLSIIRDWGFAEDYVEAMWLMLQQKNPNNFIIATGKSYSLQDFVDKAFGVFNLDWSKYVIIDKNLFRTNELKVSNVSPAKAKRELSWEAKTNFNELIYKLM